MWNQVATGRPHLFPGLGRLRYGGHSIRCASYRGHFQAGHTGLSAWTSAYIDRN